MKIDLRSFSYSTFYDHFRTKLAPSQTYSLNVILTIFFAALLFKRRSASLSPNTWIVNSKWNSLPSCCLPLCLKLLIFSSLSDIRSLSPTGVSKFRIGTGNLIVEIQWFLVEGALKTATAR